MLLENELGGYGLNLRKSLFPDDEAPDDQVDRYDGLAGSVKAFADQFVRLVDLDHDVACREFLSWQPSEDAVFSRLNIWACANTKIAAREIVCTIIASLSDEVFWDTQHQRDLLLVLAKRWEELDSECRAKIERRLIGGRPQWEGEDDDDFDEQQAGLSLNWITWLANNGCRLTFNLEVETEKLRSRTPDWKPGHAESAARPTSVRSGWVQTATEHAFLLEEPLESTLAKAFEFSGRTEDHLVESDPFAGLAMERPVRALAALRVSAERGEYPEWAWHTFLNHQRRNDDPPRFSALIAERLSSYPTAAVSDLIRPASDWLLVASRKLASIYPASFEKVTIKLIEVLCLKTVASGTTIIRTSDVPDWATEALNAPAGKIAQALFMTRERTI